MGIPVIRAVVFDAVGTLITPEPDVVAVYHDAGRRHGSRRTPAEIAGLFGPAFAGTARAGRDAAGLHATSEDAERAFWRTVVGVVLSDLEEPAATACFEELFAHFSRPVAWRVYPDAAAALRELRKRGVTTAVASNFDARLHGVFEGHPELSGIERRFVSSEVGWRKPDRRFFEAVVRGMRVPAKEILYVGDDPSADVTAAEAAGLRALLIRRDGRRSRTVITHLTDVADLFAPASDDDGA